MNKELFFFVIFLFSILSSKTFAAPDLPKSVELIADKYYLRQETIELLYDKHIDYEKAFNCKKAFEQVSGPRTDILCVGKANIVTLVIFIGKHGYASYIITCPAGVSKKKLDPYNLVKSAFKSEKPSIVNGETRTMHYMGRTDGWVRDFENLFLTIDYGSLLGSCWALNKR